MRAVKRFRAAMDLFLANKPDFVAAIGPFGSALARAGPGRLLQRTR